MPLSSFSLVVPQNTPIESFILRNSGNDWQNTHFRDAMNTSLLEDLSVDRQAYRPAVMYINGAYWGIMNLREKVNEHFIDANHKGVDKDEIDLLERNSVVIHGDRDHYDSLVALVQNNNVTNLLKMYIIDLTHMHQLDIGEMLSCCNSSVRFGR